MDAFTFAPAVFSRRTEPIDLIIVKLTGFTKSGSQATDYKTHDTQARQEGAL
jgi:hypothetical protein